jgi:hypothetical protein
MDDQQETVWMEREASHWPLHGCFLDCILGAAGKVQCCGGRLMVRRAAYCTTHKTITKTHLPVYAQMSSFISLIIQYLEFIISKAPAIHHSHSHCILQEFVKSFNKNNQNTIQVCHNKKSTYS